MIDHGQVSLDRFIGFRPYSRLQNRICSARLSCALDQSLRLQDLSTLSSQARKDYKFCPKERVPGQ